MTIVRVLLSWACGLLALPAAAQTWQANSFDTGALIHGAAMAHDGLVALSCTAPSPQGRALIETGDHEATRTDTPYDLVVTLSVDFLPAFDAASFWLTSPRLVIDGAAYPLPELEYSDFYGAWTGWTRFDAPGILELFDAASVTIDSGTGTQQTLAADGLAEALAAGLSPCLNRWLELGHPLPPRLAAHINRNAAQGAAPAPAGPAQLADEARRPGVVRDPELVPLRPVQPQDAAAITFEPPVLPRVAGRSMYDRAMASAAQVCDGPVELHEGAVWPADIDHDGVEDIVFNWGFVGCEVNGYAPGLPGMCDTDGQCRVTLFASRMAGSGLPETSFNAFHAAPEGEGLGLGRVFMSSRGSFCGNMGGTGGCMGWLELTAAGWEARGLIPLDASQTAPAPSLATNWQATPLQAFPVPDLPPPAIAAYLYETCQGAPEADFSQIGTADFDGDGRVDYVLDWGHMTCMGTVGPRPNCGAADCLIDIFLSSRGYERPEGLLAVGFSMVRLPDGRPALITGGTASTCAYEDCDAPWVFDGRQFQR